MPDLPISLACGPYDRMMGLFTGQVKVEGAAVTSEIIDTPTVIFGRMLKDNAFDVAEMALTQSFVYAMTGAARRFVVLPVFPSRMFRHGFIFVNRQSGIANPCDLAGKRIGVQGYQMTAAVWIRGVLHEDYGVHFDDVEWVEGGVNEPVIPGARDTSFRPNKPLTIVQAPSGHTLDSMLVAGEIDAIIGATIPTSSHAPETGVRRLFPQSRIVEQNYFRKTGVFPIMHALVMRRELHEQHAWLAGAVYRACDASKAWADRNMRFSGALSVMLPWLYEHLDERDAVLGHDPWPYGVEPNRTTLEAFGRHVVSDGFLSEPPRLSDIFVDVDSV